MKKNAKPEGGFWMLVEELTDDYFAENIETVDVEELKKEDPKDGYGYYPDASF